MTHVQVAVIGGGPAGLVSAIAAARAGAVVTLFDEYEEMGGQLRYRAASLDLSPELTGPGIVLAKRLLESAVDAGVQLVADAVVWGLFAGNRLAVSSSGSSSSVTADQVIVATGSTDLPFVCPGSTRPGVMTGRGLQILMHVHRLLPGKNFAVIGNDSAARELAADIERSGGSVAVVIDRADAQTIRIEGDQEVNAVVVGGRSFPVEVVAIAVGRQPDCELALMVETETMFLPALGGFVPWRDRWLRTSNPDLLVAGDAAGICDPGIAFTEGTFAGQSAAERLGLISRQTLETARESYEHPAGERVDQLGLARRAVARA